MTNNTINYKQAISLVNLGLTVDRPVILFGPPGNGKTAIGYEVERKNERVKYMPFNVSQMDTIDYRGLPDISSDSDTTEWRIPDLFRKINAAAEDDNHDYILVGLDECSQAGAATHGVLYQLIQTRRVGPHKLHDKVRFVMMGNLPKHGSGIDRRPNPILLNRGMVAELDSIELDTWLEWAYRTGIHPAITAFMFESGGSHLCKFDTKEHSSPTPRSWETASLALNELMPVGGENSDKSYTMWDKPEVVQAMIACVGVKAASKLGITLEYLGKIPKLESIFKNPSRCAMPKDRIAAVLTTHTLGGIVDADKTDAIITYMTRISKKYGEDLLGVFISKLNHTGALQKLIVSGSTSVVGLLKDFGYLITDAMKEG